MPRRRASPTHDNRCHSSRRSAVDQRIYYQLLKSDQRELSAAIRRRFVEWARSINHRYAGLIDGCRATGVVGPDIDAVEPPDRLIERSV